MPISATQQNRVNYLSVKRALFRLEKTGKTVFASINGVKTPIAPDEHQHFKRAYVESYKLRKRSYSKQAVYQRAYRLRQKAPEISHPLTPMIVFLCETIGVKLLSPEGYAIRQACDLLYSRGNLRIDPEKPNIIYVEKPAKPVETVFPLKQKVMTSENIMGLAELKPSRRGSSSKSGIENHRLEQAPSNAGLDGRDDRPAQKQNLAPEGTTLIQHFYEG